ncbi:MAG: hypothetical protein OXI12_14055 [Gammaproteobacteria bacterium]|nr:hypothetical protein [Gammaproteobacteria bacterium]
MTRTRFILAAFLLLLPVRASNLAGQDTGSAGQPNMEPSAALDGQHFLRAFEVIKRYSWSTPADSTLWRGALDGLLGAATVLERRAEAADSVAASDPIPPETEVPSSQGTVDDQRFLSTFDSIRRSGLDEPDDPMLWRGAVWGLIAALNDPYGQVLSPRRVDEFQEATTGNYAGIGEAIQLMNDRITDTAVFPG